MQRPALVVIDMLNDFLEKWPTEQKQSLVHAINQLVAVIRETGGPVIWVRQEFEPDLRDAFLAMKNTGVPITIRGTRGCHVIDGLAISPNDLIIVKKRYSAFYETGLDRLLRELKPDALIIAGINTHACVRTTAIDAYQRDWNVILAADCVGSYDQEHHSVTLNYLRQEIAAVLTNQEIRSALASA
jgi:nicotinamidase-related amidase